MATTSKTRATRSARRPLKAQPLERFKDEVIKVPNASIVDQRIAGIYADSLGFFFDDFTPVVNDDPALAGRVHIVANLETRLIFDEMPTDLRPAALAALRSTVARMEAAIGGEE